MSDTENQKPPEDEQLVSPVATPVVVAAPAVAVESTEAAPANTAPLEDPFATPAQEVHPAQEAPAAPVATPRQEANRAVLKDGQVLLGQTTTINVDVFDRVMEEPQDLKDDLGGPQPSKNARLDHEWTTPPVDGFEYMAGRPVLEERLNIYPERGEGVDKRIRALIDPEQFATDRGQFWNECLQDAGRDSAFKFGTFSGAAEREGADWRQLVEHEGGMMGMSRPRLREEGAVPASGPRAMLRVRALLGAGGIIQVPLWHSGFWITLRTPSDSALIELQRRMVDDKINYGRDTHGLAFSIDQSYMTSWLFNFCMDHVSESTAAFEGNAELMRDYIKAPDLYLMLWGLATLIWPRGFTYYRSLTTTDGIRNLKNIAGNLDIIKLLWTDRNMLKPEQKRHMAIRTRLQHTPESILKYQKTFDLSTGRKVQINENIGLVLSVPTIGSQIDLGVNWITSLVNMINETFTSAQPDTETRNNLLNLHTKVSLMRRHAPWIQAVDADGVLMTEADDIGETLGVIAQIDDDNSLRKKLDEEVKRFTDDNCVSMVGIPETEGVDTGIPRFQNIIPLNVPQTFFTLLVQRLQRLAMT